MDEYDEEEMEKLKDAKWFSRDYFPRQDSQDNHFKLYNLQKLFLE